MGFAAGSEGCSKCETLEFVDAIAWPAVVSVAVDEMRAGLLSSVAKEVVLGGTSTSTESRRLRADFEKGCLPATSLLRKLEPDDL